MFDNDVLIRRNRVVPRPFSDKLARFCSHDFTSLFSLCNIKMAFAFQQRSELYLEEAV